MLVIPRYAVTACETDHYILNVFVVMSKEEGLSTVGSLHILMVLGRISTSAHSVEMFQQIAHCMLCPVHRVSFR